MWEDRIGGKSSEKLDRVKINTNKCEGGNAWKCVYSSGVIVLSGGFK